MTCKKCENRDTLTKVLQVITWGFYLAPVAYAAYQVVRDTKILDKAIDKVKPSVDGVVDYATPYARSVAEEASKLAESLEEKRKAAVEFLVENFESLSEEGKKQFEKTGKFSHKAKVDEEDK